METNNENFLFYGNLNLSEKKEVARLLKSYEVIFNHFVGDEFLYPNISMSGEEIKVLKRKVEEQSVNPKEEYIEQDVNLFKYLSSESEKLNINTGENARALFIIKEKINPLILALKQYWNRARPYQYAYYVGADFNPLKTKSSHNPSYPSGHTIQAMCWAKILAKQYPELKDELIIIAKNISEGRMAMGVHFASDIQFGVSVADYLEFKHLLV
tara:strand:+ start:49 stop:687 length:639 start_codon:yes stop_codon:yes gene_type:complete